MKSQALARNVKMHASHNVTPPQEILSSVGFLMKSNPRHGCFAGFLIMRNLKHQINFVTNAKAHTFY